jgi:hypothetical protein
MDIYPLANDQNPRGDNLTITQVSGARHGTATIVDGNKIQYQSVPYWSGTEYLNYTCQNDKLSASSVITIVIIDHPPDVIDETYDISKNSKNNALNIFTYTNEAGATISDLDGDLMAVANVSQPVHGNATFDSYNIYYTPTTNFNAQETFQYCVTDFNDTSCANITVVVSNDPPVAVADYYTIAKNTVSVLNIMSNDYDPNGDPITIVSVNAAAYGSVQVWEDGAYAYYVPLMSTQPYTDSFEYTISDGSLFGYSQVVIDIVNSPPTAQDVSVTLHKNTNATLINLVYNDINALDVLTVTISSPPSQGSASLLLNSYSSYAAIDGDFYPKIVNNYTLMYTPEAGLYGVYSTSLKYLVSDGSDITVATVYINVINDAPVAVADTLTVNKNSFGSVNVVANDNDPNGDSIALINVGQQVSTVQGGYYIIVNTTSIEYHPPHGFLGSDSAVYTITDIQANVSNQLTATGNIAFTVVNQPPTPQPDTYVVSKGLTSFLNVIANDTDPNGDTVSLNYTGTPNSGAVVAITTYNGASGIAYTALNQTYTESWYYTAQDVDGAITQALVTVQVVNDPPVAVDDTTTVQWNSTNTIDVLANDYDINPGDKALLTIAYLSGSKSTNGGSISIISGKLVQYSPAPGYTGSDSFSYGCTDQMDRSRNNATVTIQVGDRAPLANPTTVSVHWSSSLSVNVLGIAGNGDPDGDLVIVQSVTQPSNGVVTLSNGVATYKSSNYFTGADSFGYTLSDYKLTNSSSVTVNVQNVAPVAGAVTLTVPWNAGPTTAYVTGVCSDADSDPLTIKTITPNSGFKGSLIASDSNTNVLFTPSKDYAGVQTATYVVTDGPATASNTITINVTNINKPTASDISKSVHWSTQTTGTTISLLSVGQTDADGDALTVSTVSTPSHGTVTFTNVSVTYKQTAGYTGADSFTYTITDGLNTATATISMNIYDNAPVAVDQTYSVFWGTYSTGNTFAVLTGASDIDPQDTVTLKSVGTPSQGTATISNNQVVYKPAQGNLNTATFTYTVTDGLIDTTKQVTVTVTDTKPVAVADSVSVHWNTVALDINVMTNDYDADSDTISLNAITSQPAVGSLAIKSPASNGIVTFTLPTGTFSLGSYTGKYTITDGALISDAATININITNNNKPTASPITNSVHWRTTAAGFNTQVLTSTTDADGDSLALSIATNAYATVTTTGVRYQRANFASTDTLSYTVSDGHDSASSTIIITSYNNAPSANNIGNQYIPYSAYSSGVQLNLLTLGSASDVDTADQAYLVISAVTQPSTTGSTVTIINSGQAVTFMPAANFTGTDSFTYTVSDGLATVTRTCGVYATYVAAGNARRSYTVHWLTYLKGSNFSVLDGFGNTGNSMITQIKSSTGGNTVAVYPQLNQVNNTLFFQQSKTFLDTDVITLAASDGAATSEISVSVTVYDTAPAASNLQASGKWNAAIVTNLLVGASDADAADTVSISNYTNGAYGTVTKTSTSNVSYVATGGYVGTDSYSYTVTDGLLTTTRSVSVTIQNNPPVAVAQTYTTHWRVFMTGINKAVTSGATDADGDTISLVSVTQPDDSTAGSVTALLGSNTVNINGTSTPYYGKSFKFTYTITDGAQNGKVTQSVTVSVTNNAPVAVADTDSIHWRTTAYSKNVLANDYDNDAVDVPYLKITAATAGSGGTVTFNNTNIIYTPKASFTGTEAITYTITDGAQTASTTYTVTVYDNAPTAAAISVQMHSSLYATGIVIPVTNNPTLSLRPTDQDAADAPYLVVSGASVATGTVAYSSTSVTYKSVQNQLGANAITYVVSDGLKTGQNTITVTVYDNAPTNTDYTGQCSWRTCISNGVSVTVTTNAADVDPQDQNNLVYALSTSPAYGTVTLTSNGVFLYKLKSGQGSIKTDSFKFTTSDGTLTATNTITITIANNAPVAYDDSYRVHWLSAQAFIATVTSNDTDADSDPFTIQSISTSTSPNGATLSISTDKSSINYALAKSSITSAKLEVADKFTYKITDTVDSSNSATVAVTVYDQAPVAASTSGSTKWSTAISFTLGSLCSDPDGALDTVSFSGISSQPAAGSVAVTTQSTGIVKYTPSTSTPSSTSYNIPYTFTYACTDGLLSGTGTVTVSVSNNAPTLTAGSFSVQHNYNSPAVTISGLLTNGADADGDTLRVGNLQTSDSSVTTSWSATSDTATVTTQAGFVGAKTLTWTVYDGQLYSAAATYTVNLLNNNPVCQAYTASTNKNTVATITTIASKCSDANNDPMTYTVGTPSFGTATLSSGTLTYTPAVRRSGVATVTYTATDIAGGASTYTVSVTVTNRAPTAPAATYSFVGSHVDGTTYTMDYINDAPATDVDTGDSVSLVSASSGTCISGNYGTAAISNNKVVFTRKYTSTANSCTLIVVVTDNDQDNPMTSSATITINMAAPAPPVANDDKYSVNQNAGNLQIPTGTNSLTASTGTTYAGMLSNDVAPTGVSIVFDSMSCGTGQCRKTPQLSADTTTISYPVDSTSCVQDKFSYQIRTVESQPMYASAIVYISFVNCYCTAALDIFFIIDSSSSIGNDNFNTQRDFLVNLTAKLDVASDKVNIGVAQFSNDGYLYSSLSSSATTVNSVLTNLPYVGGGTHTLGGINTAIADITGTFLNNGTTKTANGRVNVPKVLVILTDGASNAPCSCGTSLLYSKRNDDYGIMTCKYFYQSASSTPTECNSPNYPGLSCTNCNYGNFYNQYQTAGAAQTGCMPCADPIKLTDQVNSWTINSTTGVSASKYTQFPMWKVIAMGIGSLVNNTYGRSQLSGMHYNHNELLLISWANLNQAVSTIIDAACNTAS